MTHRFKPDDELDFEDHRWQHSRALRVKVVQLLGEPEDTYLVQPIPSGRTFPAFEDELSRPREEYPLATR